MQKNHKYYRLQLSKNNKVNHFLVHRLVADAFIDKPAGLKVECLQVHHIDGNTLNNDSDNLLWIPKEKHK